MSEVRQFEADLEAVFEEKASEFSPELRKLLLELWRQGELAGAAREREERVKLLASSKPSECGRYWCIPVPEEVLALEAAARPPATPLEHQPLEELLASAKKAFEKLPASRSAKLPRVRTRTRANAARWEPADLRIESERMWRQEFFGSFVSSPATSTTVASNPSGTGSPTDDRCGRS